MNRRVIRLGCVLGLLLAGGAIVNVAVAWACCFGGIPASARSITPKEIRTIMAEQDVVAWETTVYGARHEGPGQSVRVLTSMPSMVMVRSHAGLPFAALTGDWGNGWTFASKRARTPVEARSAWLYVLHEPSVVLVANAFPGLNGPKVTVGTALPLLPMWPGFAINTVLYAVLMWLLVVTPGKVRRFVRAKRRRCPACGYQIAEGVGPVCSECGECLPRSIHSGQRSPSP